MDATDHIDANAREGLIRQLVSWVAERSRSYAEAMEAWSSQCSALTIWEDALAERLIAVEPAPGGAAAEARVRLTEAGRRLLGRDA